MSENDLIKYSDLESKRFGFRIFRGTMRKFDAQKILSVILKDEVDIAILRFPSDVIGELSSLSKMGIPYITADTLVNYYLDLNNYGPKQLKNTSLTFIAGSPEHSVILDGLTARIFSNYSNHYRSNPFLRREDILAGYKEWVQDYIDNTKKGHIAWLVKNAEEYVAFATCSFIDDECEIVLNGVAQEASGIGIYTDLIRFTQQHFKKKGLRMMKVSTQIQNYAVQKAWLKEGFTLKESYYTIHFNSFMRNSIYPKKVFNLTGKDIAYYLTPSFVFNVASGSITDLNSKLYITSYSYKSLKKIEHDSNYQLKISFPCTNPDEGYYKMLLRIMDKQNNVCIFSYYELCKG